MKSNIVIRDYMIGLPTFSKTFDIDIKAVRRMVERGKLSGEQLDGRVFINLDAVTAAAVSEGMTVSGYVATLARQSKR